MSDAREDDALADLKREANDAIWTHHSWVSVLKRAIETRTSKQTVAEVADSSACSIGVWLLTGIPAHLRDSPLYETTVRAHDRFHAEAAVVLEAALAGNAPTALSRMHRGGMFFEAAANMRSALYEWANIAQP